MALNLTTRFSVEAEDLDGNNHFNNARQVVRYDDARGSLLVMNGLGPRDLIKESLIFVASEQAYKHKMQAFLGDEIVINTMFEKEGRVSFPFYQEMFRGNDLISTGKGVYCFTDFDRGRIVRNLPSHILDKFSE